MDVDINECREYLKAKLVCTFGYSEVEDEILERCLEAIEAQDMAPLKKNLCVFCAGDFSLYQMSATRACLRLYKTGIWQYVKKKIEESKKAE